MSRQLLGSFFVAAAVVSLNVTVRAMSSDPVFQEDTFVPKGKYFQANVPDTLDLPERAKLSVHGLTSFLNPESTRPPARYGPFGHTYFNADPPYMSDMPGGPPNWGNTMPRSK
jgi:hypothetical protein